MIIKIINMSANNQIYINWGKKDNNGKRDMCDTRLDEAEKMVNYIKNIIPKESKTS